MKTDIFTFFLPFFPLLSCSLSASLSLPVSPALSLGKGSMDDDRKLFAWCAAIDDANPWYEITVPEGFRIAGIRIGTSTAGIQWVSSFNVSMKATPSSPFIAADVLVKGLEMPFSGLSIATKKQAPPTYFTATYKVGNFFKSTEYVYATTVRFIPTALGTVAEGNNVGIAGQTYTCARIGLLVCATSTTTTTKTTTETTTTSQTTSTTTSATVTTTTTAVSCGAGLTYAALQGACVPYTDVLAPHCGAGTVLEGSSCVNNASLVARLKEAAKAPFDADNGASYCGSGTSWDGATAKCVPAAAWSQSTMSLVGVDMPLWVLIALVILVVLLISTCICCCCACYKCKCFATDHHGAGAGGPPGVKRRSKMDAESYTNPAWRQSFKGSGQCRNQCVVFHRESVLSGRLPATF